MSENNESSATKNVSRRNFLRGLGLAGAGSTLAADLLLPREAEAKSLPELPSEASEISESAVAEAGVTLKPGFQTMTLTVNGKSVPVQVEPRTTLLNALRNHANPPITGPKLVCDQGACGGCTVHVEGKTAYGCMLLAADMVGKKITTVEGLTKPDGSLDPVQAAFIASDALMCGFCTPGFIMSVKGLLAHNPNPTREEVQKACAGNVCRCGTYPHIFEAALSVNSGGTKKSEGKV